MRTDGPVLDRAAAERLLDGDRDVPGHESLAALLTAASGPARDGELDGEDAAVAAFREARSPHGVPAPRDIIEGPVRHTGRGWLPSLSLASLKALAVVVGTATAIITVVHVADPGPLGGEPIEVPESTTPSRPGPTGSPIPGLGPGPVPRRPPSKNVTQAMQGPCREYDETPPAQRRQRLTEPEMDSLVRAAGGPDRVDAFCAAVLAPSPSASSQGTPSSEGDAPREESSGKARPTPKPRPGNNGNPPDGGNGGVPPADDDAGDDDDDDLEAEAPGSGSAGVGVPGDDDRTRNGQPAAVAAWSLPLLERGPGVPGS